MSQITQKKKQDLSHVRNLIIKEDITAQKVISIKQNFLIELYDLGLIKTKNEREDRCHAR